jgi:molecular chaperone HtpG
MEKRWEKTEEDEKEKEVEKLRIINNTNPLWKETPANLKNEDYLSFYRELYPATFEEPLFQIHLNVDYPFNLNGILYFPKVKNQFEIQKNKVQLYCNQVFITDQLEGIIPEFMMLLHGVIDSPDIPLNVSRSYLQSDANVKKISSHITKKVAEKLEDMFKNNREDFEKKWDDLKVFLQYGSITDEKFYDRIKDIFLLKNIENQYFTIEEYKTKISALQKDKNDTLIYLYSSDTQAQHLYIDTAKEKGYDVLLLDGFLDTHFINMLETKLEKTKFSRVDADIIDKIIEKDEIQPSKLAEKEQEKLKKFFQEQVDEKKFSIQIENLSETDLPIIITQNEFMRRFQDMEKIAGQQKLYGQFEHYNLIVNANHNLATKILNEKSKKKRDALVQQLIDLSLLSQNILTGEKLSEFVKRSIELL